MNQYERTTEKKKSAIIDSALTLFRERGSTDVSMKEIASKASVSQASIYNYYGSKEAVVAACVSAIMAETFTQIDQLLEEDLKYSEKLERALSICTESVNLSISEHFSSTAMQDQKFVQLLIENLNLKKTAIYERFVKLGKQESIIDPAIPDRVYLMYINAINSIGADEEFNKDLIENTRHIHQLFLYGLIGK